MPSLERFERLVNTTVALRPTELHYVGQSGELTESWILGLNRFPRTEQISQAKTILTELIISNIDDDLRLTILGDIFPLVERLVANMHGDYVHNPQSPKDEQEALIFEVRSLYFLMILCYQGVAVRNMTDTANTAPQATQSQSNGSSWLQKLNEKLNSNVIAPTNAQAVSPQKRLMALAVWRMMSIYFKLLLEFALTYQKVPAFIWGQMNAWYLKAATQSIDHLDINKLNPRLPTNSINQQYVQGCLANFANLFAYRRPDILHIFKVLPTWVKYTQTTFTANPHFKVFVNMQAATPPEFITPYSSVNPYSNEHICLFFDVKDLFIHLKSIENSENPDELFEARMAKIVLLAFARQLENNTSTTRIQEHLADMMTGFFNIFNEMANGVPFGTLINQTALPENQRPRLTNRVMTGTKETVKVLTKSEAGVQFVFGDIDARKAIDVAEFNLSVFGLFALKSQQSTNKHPWMLGIIHWAEPTDTQIAVDGKIFGRILSVCGVRLRVGAGDTRPQDFIQAILASGDGFNHQTTLIMPRYHFKENDTVIIRSGDKESTLRLEKNLLTTDDIEQYTVVRLV